MVNNQLWNPPQNKTWKYIIQYGQDFFPKATNSLPNDVPYIGKGDWAWSAQLNGWIGYLLSQEENEYIYENRILAYENKSIAQ